MKHDVEKFFKEEAKGLQKETIALWGVTRLLSNWQNIKDFKKKYSKDHFDDYDYLSKF